MNLNNITTALKTGITIYQYEQWQNTGSVNLMQKESHMLSKVWLKTNIHNPDSLDKPFIQLSATFTSEFDIQEYNEWLNANQYKLYPLLLDILKISLKDNFYNYSNASNIHYEGGKFPSMLTIQLFNLEFYVMKTIAYIISTYHIGTYDLDIRDVLKSYIIARYYGWEPKEEDLEEIIFNTSYFNINVDDAIYEVLTMPREEITI